MSVKTFDASNWSVDSLHGRWRGHLQSGPPVTLRLVYLDSFDWKIHRAGSRLSIESAGRKKTLRWVEADRAPYVLPTTGDLRFATDLPPGFLRDRLEKILGVRVLFTMGSNRVVRQAFQKLDDHGDTALRMTLDELTPIDSRGRLVPPSHRMLTVIPLPGRDAEARSLVKALEKDGAVHAPKLDPLTLAAEVLGRFPGDYRSKPLVVLKPKTRTAKAVRSILVQLLETLLANVGGVVQDLDIEFLHDFRVATRRTRSVLSQLKGVFPKKETKRFSKEFKWLGEITGPRRDLDVNLFEMDGFRNELGVEDATLRPLHRLLNRSRAAEHRRVKRALDSRRFHDLTSDWSSFLEVFQTSTPKPPDAERPVAEVANERILKAYLRMVKRGAGLGDDPEPAQLHRLRIDAKKLRYLLEFFASLYPKNELAPLVKELKLLQDMLGGFNDMEVQQVRLAAFADQLITTGAARSETVFAMGRLADAMKERQEIHRHDFASRFSVFSSRESRRRYRRLFGGKDR